MNRRQLLKQTILLGGVALSAPTLMSALTACTATKKNTPQVLSTQQASTLAEVVDTILPRTETPGAKDLEVDKFIERVIAQLRSGSDQASIRQAIDDFNARSRERFGKNYVDLGQVQRHQMLEQEERDAGTYNPTIWGATVGKQEPVGFYRELKSLAIWGYYTSEYIGKNVLNYDLIPGEQKGCIPVEEVGNSWSL